MDEELQLEPIFRNARRFEGKGPFLISQPEKVLYLPQRVVLKAGESRNILEVYVSDKDPISFSKEGRKVFEASADVEWLGEQLRKVYSGSAYSVELANEKSKMRWAAGGMLPVDAHGNAFFLFRDAGAPSYPLHFTAATGLSETAAEIIEPMKILLREGLEEIALKQGDAIVVPAIMNIGLKNPKELSKMVVFDALEKMGKPVRHYRFAEAELDKGITDVIRVYYKGELASETYGMLCFDPKTAGIDVVGVMRVDADFEKMVPFDTEVVDKSGDRKNLDREIHMVKTADIIKSGEGLIVSRSFKSQKVLQPRAENALRMTPPLKSAVMALKA